MIVFDASTLILLAKAELLENFLEHIGRPIVIPRAVQRECYGIKQSLDALLIQKAVAEEKIKIEVIKDRKLYGRILSDFALGRGESEAIALAVSANAALVAIDDRQGINACKLLGMPFTTAINIVVRTREKHLINNREAMAKFEALAKYGRYRIATLKEARAKLEAVK
jgi:predicted nucleic acid-binding protein